MKKLLNFFMLTIMISSTSSTVISCNGFEQNDKIDSRPAKISIVFKPIELSPLNSNFDYTYKTKEEYLLASKYYINQAISQGKNTYKYFQDNENSEKRAASADFIFKSQAWYGNEGQWDLIRVDEIDGNYKYDEIDIDSLTDKDYSKEWFEKRKKVLKNYIDYYKGVVFVEGTIEYYAYDGGMQKALENYKFYKEYQIINPLSLNMIEFLKKDIKFIDNLTLFWKTRFEKIEKLWEKIEDI